MAIRNRFGWSISREAMFDACARSYYFHYYLSWGGWTGGASPLAREAFLLKRLTSLPLWRGQLVHYVATKVLASMRARGRIPALEDVLPWVEERFRRQLDFSARKLYLREPKKKGGRLNVDWLALIDHEYGRELSPAATEKTLEECREGVRGLLGSSILEEILATDPSTWVIENIDMAEFAQSFELEGALVFAKTDFMYRGAGGTFDIVDWKTFAPRKDSGEDSGAGEAEGASGEDGPAGPRAGKARVQLGVYGFYASEVLGEPLETIRLHEVNLLAGGESVDHPVGGKEIEESRQHVSRGIERLAAVLVGSDRDRNEPLPHEQFPCNVTPLCRYCNFYRICRDPESGLRLE